MSEKEIRKKKGLSTEVKVLLTITIVVLIVVLTLALIYFYKQHYDRKEQEDQRMEEAKNGVVVDEKNGVKPGIKVIPDEYALDENGNKVPISNKIVNDSDIVMSDDLKRAIEIETSGSCNSKMSVNGIDVNGSINIDGGYAEFFDKNGVSHTVKVDGSTIMYGDNRLSDDVIKLMDNTSYDGNDVVFKNVETVCNYNGGNEGVTFTYKCDGGVYGSTNMCNISEKNHEYYSNGVKMDDVYQKYMTTFDKILDNKFPATKNDSFFPEYNGAVVNAIENQNDDKNNSDPNTNLLFYNNRSAKLF